MAAFYQMHLNGGRYGDKQVLSRKAVAEMHKKQVAVSRGMNYGLGFFLVGPTQNGVSRTFQHGGAFGTFCWADSSRQLVGVFFSQAGLQKTAPVLSAVQKKVYELLPAGEIAPSGTSAKEQKHFGNCCSGTRESSTLATPEVF